MNVWVVFVCGEVEFFDFDIKGKMLLCDNSVSFCEVLMKKVLLSFLNNLKSSLILSVKVDR